MSKESQKFKVPDALANLYDFANTLDVRHFIHHGAVHEHGDELKGPRELGAWMSRRGLLFSNAKISSAMFESALQLRAALRDYLQRDPTERGGDWEALRSLNRMIGMFPLVADARGKDGLMLRAARDDALAGLSAIVAELYDASRNGTLDRLKMCASDECHRVFFDRSKPATRRWCMSNLCGNRVKTRNYRERLRNSGQ
jgi:predicted RNA-binding Zn ribbon-like protein